MAGTAAATVPSDRQKTFLVGQLKPWVGWLTAAAEHDGPTPEDHLREWRKIAYTLNSMPRGAVMSPGEWRSVSVLDRLRSF